VSVNPLHRARLGAGIALHEVAARTCLSPRIVQLIDRGHFDLLPGGIYARSYVRSFAAVVGLQPEEVVRELSDQLPPDEDPLPALRENARAYLPPIVRDLTRWTTAAKASLASRLAHLRLPSRRWSERPTRLAATVLDVAILFVLYAAFIRATAWVAGLDVLTALVLARFQVAALCAVVGLIYFVIFGGIGGRTPGAAICGVSQSSDSAPLGLRDIWLRTLWRSPNGASSLPPSSWERDTHHLDPADSTV
jgi:hypothetical protein